jgi:hypothetical protein
MVSPLVVNAVWAGVGIFTLKYLIIIAQLIEKENYENAQKEENKKVIGIKKKDK